jgi:(2R)-3-sulfolactate dehydrogenase (NADP+)
MPTLSLGEAEELTATALERSRTAKDTARTVAKALVLAEADGIKTHGLIRAPLYAAQAKTGKVDGFATPRIERPRPGVAVIDARNGFAYPAIDLAVSVLPEMTSTCGISAAGIGRSHHCGAAGHHAERLADAGLVALFFANGPAAMAPWGGRRAVFGTNPIAFACPLPGRAPIVVDLSLSKVARGNVLAAAKKGEPIPEGWALDAKGWPTTDAQAALEGTMLPVGDAKGTALALLVELIAAGMTGSNFAADASSYFDAEGPPSMTGQFIIAMDPSAFASGVERFAVLARWIEEDDGARLPGMRRYALRKQAQADGILVSDALLAEIRAL